MKNLARAFVLLVLLGGIGFGCWYVYRQLDKKPSDPETPRPVAGSPNRPAPPGPNGGGAVAPATRDPALLDAAREAYDEGRFAEALDLLGEASARPGEGDEEIRRLQRRSRLAILLLQPAQKNARLDGPPLARFRIGEGPPQIVAITDESREEIEYETERGGRIRIRRAVAVDLKIARAADDKTFLFEEEYRRRHDGIGDQAAALALARWCWEAGLAHHVPYLVEKAMDLPGDAAVQAVAAAFPTKSGADREETRDLLVTFWPGAPEVRRALAAGGAPPPNGRPGIVVDGPRAGGEDDGRGRGGIGSAAVTVNRTGDKELDALLDKAEAATAKGDDHYRQAQPGQPDPTRHRELAIESYREAIATYERIEERWDLNLERVYTHLYEHLNHMLKDVRVK